MCALKKDFSALRIAETVIATGGGAEHFTSPLRRPGEESFRIIRFVRTMPLPWIRIAAVLPGRALAMGIALWHLAGLERSQTVRLSSDLAAEFGFGRHSAYRGLVRLESARLITVKRQNGREPLVQILPAPDKVVDEQPAQKDAFVGKIPLWWVQRAAALGGKALALGVAVRYFAGLKRTYTIRLSAKLLNLFSISNDSAVRALSKLESAHLLMVERHNGRRPTLWIINDISFEQGQRHGSNKRNRH
jgi:hypothetical protein